MLEAKLTARLNDDLLHLSVMLKNAGDEEIIVAARAPYKWKNTNLLYIGGSLSNGEVHLHLGDPTIPDGINVYQPLTAFYRFLRAGDEITETFIIPSPLSESSAYYAENVAGDSGSKTFIEVTSIRLTIDWAPSTLIHKQIPVDDEIGLWNIWYSNKELTTIKVESPPGVQYVTKKSDLMGDSQNTLLL